MGDRASTEGTHRGTISRRGSRISQQHNAEAFGLRWRARVVEDRAPGNSGLLSHTHNTRLPQVRSTQLGEKRQRTAGHNGTHLPRTWAPKRLKKAEGGFQEAGNSPLYHTIEPVPRGALAAPSVGMLEEEAGQGQELGGATSAW